MLRDSNLQELDAFIVHARLEPKINSTSSNLLNGAWFTQTIGTPAEKIKMKIICRLDVVNMILNYYTTKSYLYVTFLGMDKHGFILNLPTHDIAEPDETNPRYNMEFELAVVSDV